MSITGYPAGTPNIFPVEQAASETDFTMIKGFLFLYPFKASWEPIHEIRGVDKYKEIFQNEPDLFRTEDGLELCVQVWAHNDECSNWAAHGNTDISLEFFPNYFPIRLLIEKKEGDTIEFECSKYKKKFSIICQQRDSRYDPKYDFEQALEKTFQKTYSEMKNQVHIIKKELWEKMLQIEMKFHPNLTGTIVKPSKKDP